MDNNPVALNDVLGLSTGGEGQDNTYQNSDNTENSWDKYGYKRNTGNNNEKNNKWDGEFWKIFGIVLDATVDIALTIVDSRTDDKRKVRTVNRASKVYEVEQRQKDEDALPNKPKPNEKYVFNYGSTDKKFEVIYVYNANKKIWEKELRWRKNFKNDKTGGYNAPKVWEDEVLLSEYNPNTNRRKKLVGNDIIWYPFVMTPYSDTPENRRKVQADIDYYVTKWKKLGWISGVNFDMDVHVIWNATTNDGRQLGGIGDRDGCPDWDIDYSNTIGCSPAEWLKKIKR